MTRPTERAAPPASWRVSVLAPLLAPLLALLLPLATTAQPMAPASASNASSAFSTTDPASAAAARSVLVKIFIRSSPKHRFESGLTAPWLPDRGVDLKSCP